MLDAATRPLLMVLESISMIAFAVLAYRFYLVARDLGGERVYYYCYGFLLLSASQAVMFLSVAYINPRVSLSLYTASSTLSLAGFYAFAYGRRATSLVAGNRFPVIAVVWLKSVVAVIDYITGFIGMAVSAFTRGLAKYLIAVIALSYITRGSSLLASIVSGEDSLLAILLVGELARSIAATLLSIAYVVPGSERE
ncbi:MAG: hypothetical protein F7C07_00655 [Desulfurococcales archaeon]|nr:hypothetical protein [Desulfurococcales archaeon]